jgi:hypothetical protein
MPMTFVPSAGFTLPGVMLAALLATAAPVLADPAGETLDMAAFAHLKTLAGQWHREGASGDPVTMQLEVTSNGKAMIERLFPGTPHEMTTVYYLAYDRLLATHYCAIGNQPAYQLAPTSVPAHIVMEFAGGTGFDPKTDQHAHGVQIKTIDANHIDVEWEFRKGDEAPTRQRMLLERAAPVTSS